MDLQSIEEHHAGGRFGEAMAALERLSVPRHERPKADALLVELLERTGQYSKCRELAQKLLSNNSTSPLCRSVCDSSMALIAADEGHTQDSVVR